LHGQGLVFATQLGRVEVVGEHCEAVGERHLGGRLCGAQSIVAKVEDYFKDQLSQPFDLTPDLCGWVSCEFRNQAELALIAFAKARKAKVHTQWSRRGVEKGRAWCLHAPLGFDGRKWRIIYVR
jgi:hypothetical protein